MLRRLVQTNFLDRCSLRGAYDVWQAPINFATYDVNAMTKVPDGEIGTSTSLFHREGGKLDVTPPNTLFGPSRNAPVKTRKICAAGLQYFPFR